MSMLRIFLRLFALFALSSITADVHSQERVRIGISSLSLGFFPTMVAEKKGFYTKYGLTPEHVLVPCAIATTALLSDDLD